MNRHKSKGLADVDMRKTQGFATSCAKKRIVLFREKQCRPIPPAAIEGMTLYDIARIGGWGKGEIARPAL
jgi:hypothetical protein